MSRPNVSLRNDGWSRLCPSFFGTSQIPLISQTAGKPGSYSSLSGTQGRLPFFIAGGKGYEDGIHVNECLRYSFVLRWVSGCALRPGRWQRRRRRAVVIKSATRRCLALLCRSPTVLVVHSYPSLYLSPPPPTRSPNNPPPTPIQTNHHEISFSATRNLPAPMHYIHMHEIA